MHTLNPWRLDRFFSSSRHSVPPGSGVVGHVLADRRAPAYAQGTKLHLGQRGELSTIYER